ncbi:hypothetical protein K440DRAFT_618275 [Wilcoxina mikolae CBS 423.85]|nr:hypothetical protein K440DRAFT_618275 [Wilcoxina mikolae CBS 423.85]
MEDGVEKPGYPNGYSSFAAFIATDPELSVYRTFQRITSRNLLYLQSELRMLEDELDQLDKEDLNAEPGTNRHVCSQCFERLSALEESDPGSKTRMNLIRKLRVLAKEYQEALILQSQVLGLSPPSKRVLKVMKKCFELRPLVGHDETLFEDDEDLIALAPPKNQDRFSVFLQNHCGILFRSRDRANAMQPGAHAFYYRERHIETAVTIISTALAAFLLLGAIGSLRAMNSENGRLGLIALFTSLFAGSFSIFSNARRADIFAASAAYAAVLVVFISGH